MRLSRTRALLIITTRMMTVRFLACFHRFPSSQRLKRRILRRTTRKKKMKDPCLELGATTAANRIDEEAMENEDDVGDQGGQSTGEDELIGPPLRHKKSSALRSHWLQPSGLQQWQTIPEEGGEEDHQVNPSSLVSSGGPPRRQRKVIHIQQLDDEPEQVLYVLWAGSIRTKPVGSGSCESIERDVTREGNISRSDFIVLSDSI